MKSVRIHGKSPFNVAVIHGGPGAAGDLYPLAKGMSGFAGIVEPLQTKQSIGEIVKELHQQIHEFADLPLTFIGHSWGAWLSVIYTAKFKKDVARLILVSSGSWLERYADGLMGIRAQRLSIEQRKRLNRLMNELHRTRDKKPQNEIFKAIGNLFSQIDSYALLPIENPEVKPDYKSYYKVWNEAIEFRRNGDLLRQAEFIDCPVTVIHGDYDPHSVEGVVEPLQQIHHGLKVFVLKNCGHSPWKEKYARDEFYRILKKELERG